MQNKNLYCYVDETGQDTGGKLFLVSVVITKKDLKEKLGARLLEIEKQVGKRNPKWHGTAFNKKIDYLNAILQIKKFEKNIFYSVYETTKEYTSLITYTVAKAVRMKSKGECQVVIIIDGLNKKERELTKIGLKQLGIKYKKVVGARDESDAFVRLADSLAGFLRDYEEDKSYTKIIFERFLDRKFLTKLE